MKKRWLTIILSTLALLLLLGIGGFIGWGTFIPAPMPETAPALQSDALVTVTFDHWWSFEPADTQPTTGLILYPGARVPLAAYAPAAHALAEQGYLVVIPTMPLNFAIFGINKASQVIAAYPQIKHWAVSGHSLGGAMAAQYASSHLDQIEGLVLWASYPATSNDLSQSRLKVVSISATLDGLATPAKIEASHPLLPPEW